MFKKTLISLAVASSVGLTGCFDSAGSGSSNADPDYKINNPDFSGKTWPIFNPLSSELPLPNDLIFDSEQGDGTFGVPDSVPPVTTALNELSGASTVAPAVIRFNGLIDPDTVTYGETVFLIELAYASGDPVRGLSAQEPPTVAGVAAARADVETLSGTSAIRILPLTPLKPQTRYIAVATKGINDINGDAISPSPSYINLTDAEQPVGNSLLSPVKALINGLWEPSAEGFFAVAGNGLTADDIALSYSFTTSPDEKVLQYIAEPAAWFRDQVTSFVASSAASAALAGGASDYTAVKDAVDNALAAYPLIPLEDGDTIADKLAALFGGGAPCEGSTGDAALDCTAISLASSFAATGALPTPLPTSAANISLTDPAQPVGLVSAVAGQLDPTNSVLAAQGTITLPYYLGSDAPSVLAKSWQADDALAAGLNDEFVSIGLEIPQADSTVSTAVNYVFPFPKKQRDVTVPLLALYPADGTKAKGVVIYQHGITTDRSTALTFGTALAADGYVVVAIDQPVHGVAAFTAEEQTGLATQLITAAVPEGTPQENIDQLVQLTIAGDLANLTTALGGDAAAAMSLINTVANAGSTVPGLAPMEANERHFGLYAPTPGSVAAIDYDAGIGDSGSLFINLLNFTNTRDNMRQSALDKMGLRVSLPGLSLPNATDGSPLVTLVPTDEFFFAGHSLGTITGAPFVASVNENQLPVTVGGASPIPSTFNDIAAASMLTPGGGIVRMLESSRSFAPRILLGLQGNGLNQGDANYELFLDVFQATIDTADPVNFNDNLETSTPAYLLSIAEGDTVIPNAADEELWGVPALDATVPPAVSGLPIPVTVDSFNAPLAGSLPLTQNLEADFTFYDTDTYPGINHGTPASADPAGAFGQMVMETDELFNPAP